MQLRYNVAVNLVGRAVTIVIGLVLLPIYLKILGVEAVGLIGFYTTLIGVVGLIDHTFGVVIMRESARTREMADGAQRQRDLLRTTEIFYALLSATIALGIAAASPLLARVWLSASTLSAATIGTCLLLMAATIPFQLLSGLHIYALNGRERQAQANGLSVFMAASRGVLAVAAVLLIARTTEVFFTAQLVAIGLCFALSFFSVWHTMPSGNAPRMRLALLRDTWRYSSALTANAVLFVILAQADKLLVSALTSLETFGYYVLASTLAAFPSAIVGPITSALLPRFSRLLERGANDDVRHLLHLASQFVSLLAVPFGAVALFFPETLALLWTGDTQAAASMHWTISLLATGTVLLTLTCVPNVIAFAAGRAHLAMFANLSALVVLPFGYWLTIRHGANGATSIWLGFGIANFLFVPLLVHHRVLRIELGRWYLLDIGLPMVAAGVVCAGLAQLLPPTDSRIGLLAELGLAWSMASMAALVVSSRLRPEVVRLARASVGRPNRLLPPSDGQR